MGIAVLLVVAILWTLCDGVSLTISA